MRNAVSARSRRSAFFRCVSSSGSSTFSRAEKTGIRLKNWNTKPMCAARNSASSSSERSLSLRPPTLTWPSEGRSRPARMFRSVDLPEPEGPISATKRPAGISSETSSSACTSSTPRV